MPTNPNAVGKKTPGNKAYNRKVKHDDSKRKPAKAGLGEGKRSKSPKNPETGLTPELEAFCLYRIQGYGQSDAFIRAFPEKAKWERTAIWTAASVVGNNEKVKARIEQLQRISARDNEITASAMLAEYLAIAKADARELTQVWVFACRRCYGVGHRHQFTDGELEDAISDHEKKRAELIAAEKGDIGPFDEKGGGGYSAKLAPNPDCPSCGGAGHSRVVLSDTRNLSDSALALFDGAKQTKEGLEIMMADKAKARESVARHIGFYSEDSKQEVSVVVDMAALEALYERKAAEAKARDDAVKDRSRRAAAGELDPKPSDPEPDAKDPGDGED